MDVAADTEVFIYTGAGEAVIPRDVVRVRVDPSVTLIPAKAFEGRKKLTPWSCVKASLKSGMIPSLGVIVRLQKSTSPTHSGGLMIGPSCPLFNVPFAFTMTLKALD